MCCKVDSPKKARLKASNTLTIMELLLSNAELPLRFELATYSEVGAIRVRIAQRIAQQITINIHRSQGNACADTATATATAYWMSCSRFDAVTTGTFFGCLRGRAAVDKSLNLLQPPERLVVLYVEVDVKLVRVGGCHLQSLRLARAVRHLGLCQYLLHHANWFLWFFHLLLHLLHLGLVALLREDVQQLRRHTVLVGALCVIKEAVAPDPLHVRHELAPALALAAYKTLLDRA
mmetsp:Transcript_2173/g.4534  ORF Transcript_2173/g.4534 Transcript_2173/m.4534 type:complete len:234 (-) Transcript_2173:662-1363(-)